MSLKVNQYARIARGGNGRPGPAAAGRGPEGRGRAGRKKNLRRPWQAEWSELIVGKRIAAIRRRGKWIVVETGKPRLIVHLGMTGQLTVHKPTEPVSDHTHLVFDLSGRRELRFRDSRRFGSADVFANDVEANDYLAKPPRAGAVRTRPNRISDRGDSRRFAR